MQKISVVINTFNEEKNIKKCLESVKWADEIIIVDMHSTDKTVEISKGYTHKIYFHKKTDYVEPARNFAISKATGDWILIVDADEEISSLLSKKLLEIVGKNTYDFVKIPRKNIIFGKWIKHSGWWPDYLIRFFKKGSVYWKEEIHSVPVAKGTEFVLSQEYAITHLNYDNITQFIVRNFEVYARIEAEEKVKNGYILDYKDIVRFPLQEFLRRYFYWKGYKDGFHGLVLSLLMSIYHLLIFIYIWQENKFEDFEKENFKSDLEDEFKKAGKDVSYWITKEKLESINNPILKNIAKLAGKFRRF